MTPINVRRPSPYTADQMYQLVADVARYDEFVPYCRQAHICAHTAYGFDAHLDFGYKHIHKGFLSAVELFPDKKEIRVRQSRGVFKYLDLLWRFVPTPKGCLVILNLDYKLSIILERLLPSVQAYHIDKAIDILEQRADALYGCQA